MAEKTDIICVANQKGGVGKTTTAINLADGLVRRNRRVLLVDLDAQGNTSSIFQAESVPANRSVYAIFKDKKPAQELIQPTRIEQLDLLAAEVHLAEVETLLAGAVDGFFRLHDALHADGLDYDTIVIDCPPNLGLLTVNSFVAASHLIVPLQTAKFSLDGLKTILDTTRTVQKRFNAELQILGGLITMHNPRTAISQAVSDPIQEYIPIFQTRISRAVAIEEAHLMQQTIFEYQGRSKVAQEYKSFTDEVIGGIQKG
ncbi:MAG: ParA family protein [Leptospiraceae bacterium]|nr:ParA family protein [Leptospiraceae bacterium]